MLLANSSFALHTPQLLAHPNTPLLKSELLSSTALAIRRREPNLAHFAVFFLRYSTKFTIEKAHHSTGPYARLTQGSTVFLARQGYTIPFLSLPRRETFNTLLCHPITQNTPWRFVYFRHIYYSIASRRDSSVSERLTVPETPVSPHTTSWCS